MNEKASQRIKMPSPLPPSLPVGDDTRVLRLERRALRVDPPIVRFSVRSAA
jgi:hypothetical protein